jgi:signal transduction histidine kinase
VPFVWRRRAPLLAYVVTMGAVCLQALVSGRSTEGLHNLIAWYVGIYSVARYSRSPFAGLFVGGLGFLVFSLEDPIVMAGADGDLWATAFFGVALLACWFLGVFVRHQVEQRVSEERARQLQTAADEAVRDERARLARELHDVVSHNISVMVVQAAGARAASGAADTALANIEASGRSSLVEMRRLLGVLRADSDDASTSPNPGVASIAALVEHVEAAGVPVELRVEPEGLELTPALDLTVYRVVQEALTNVIKHAPGTAASVTILGTDGELRVDVVDEGPVADSDPDPGGHGLLGMRERVALFGGSLSTGPEPGGGFAVRARLPLGGDGR